MSQMSLPRNILNKKSLQPLSRFRAAVLMTIANLPWLKNDDYQSAPLDSFATIYMNNLILACKLSEISVFQKFILLKPPDDRTMFELETIEWMFAVGFKFFHLCPIVSI
uniref:Uncharacterized protein n=1 Tax=Schizaphis graminum TaxID=13262 RepID=A0A2S2P384_SCHGA